MESPRPTPLLMSNGVKSLAGSSDPEPPRPTPDGFLTVRTWAGGVHHFELSECPRGWKSNAQYLQISQEDGTWENFPWSSILRWTSKPNSTEYREKMGLWRAWRSRSIRTDECEGIGDAEAPGE